MDGLCDVKKLHKFISRTVDTTLECLVSSRSSGLFHHRSSERILDDQQGGWVGLWGLGGGGGGGLLLSFSIVAHHGSLPSKLDKFLGATHRAGCHVIPGDPSESGFLALLYRTTRFLLGRSNPDDDSTLLSLTQSFLARV
jgi:hypothetical protein